ncbi:MAG: acyl-CoA thioesterase [bacterium]
MIKAYEQGARSVFLVRPEHLNHQGNLFGGHLMAAVDTIGYCLLRQEFADRMFVTRAAEINFERPAHVGDVIVFEARILNLGTTSVQIEVVGAIEGSVICTAGMTFVNIGPDGKKLPL